MSSEREAKGDGRLVSDGRGTRDPSSRALLEIPSLEAAPTWPQKARQVFSVFLLASSPSHLEVLFAGEVLSQAVALPRPVSWGCDAFHDLQEALQGKASPAL